MKSQSSLLILIGIISAVMITWLFISYRQASIGIKITKELRLTKIIKYLDYFKGFSRVSLIFSSHAGTKKVADYGGARPGESDLRSWICTGPKPPDLNEVRYFLSDETIKLLNKYIEKENEAKKQEITDYYIKEYTCVDYDINEDDLDSGLFDEKFSVGAYGSYINVSLGLDNVSSSNDIYLEVSKNRFWFMYRKFKEWSERNSLRSYVCGCLPKICGCSSNGFCEDACSSFNSCVENSVERALRDLENIFDDNNISCSAELECCYTDNQACDPTSPESCERWSAPKCNRCSISSAEELCTKKLGFEGEENKQTNLKRIRFADKVDPLDCDKRIREYWKDTRGAMEATFTCQDNKHLLSTEKDRHLIFSVHTMINVRQKNCYDFSYCHCSEWECIESVCPVKKKCLNPPLCTEEICPVDEECLKEECVACESDKYRDDWCTECQLIPTPPTPPIPPIPAECDCRYMVRTSKATCEQGTPGAVGDSHLEACWQDLGEISPGSELHKYRIIWHLNFVDNQLKEMISGDYVAGMYSGFINMEKNTLIYNWPPFDVPLGGKCKKDGTGDHAYCYFNNPEGQCTNCPGVCAGKISNPTNFIVEAKPRTKIQGFFTIKGQRCDVYGPIEHPEDHCDYSKAKAYFTATDLIMTLGEC